MQCRFSDADRIRRLAHRHVAGGIQTPKLLVGATVPLDGCDEPSLAAPTANRADAPEPPHLLRRIRWDERFTANLASPRLRLRMLRRGPTGAEIPSAFTSFQTVDWEQPS